MIKAVFAILLLFLTACQTAGDVRRYCEAVTESFVAEVNCIEAYVARDVDMSEDSFLQEYVLAGRVLADKVAAGEIKENEARLQFTREYNRLLEREQRFRTYDALEWEAIRPTRTFCRQIDNHIYCDTY